MPRCSISLSYHSRLVPPPTLCACGGGFRPVLALCLAPGRKVREPYGVWGGMSEDAREAIYRRRRLPTAV